LDKKQTIFRNYFPYTYIYKDIKKGKRVMSTKKAFLEYLGNRKWKKVKNSQVVAGRSYLRYAGGRIWKKQRKAPLKH